MLNERSLVLNRHWAPIATVPIRTALVMLCRGTVQAVCPQSYELFEIQGWINRSREVPRADRVVQTPKLALHQPEIVLLRAFGGIPRRQLAFTRKNLYRRDDYTCQYCLQRKPSGQLTIDHVIPRSRGGQSSWENCVLACVGCNTRKANKSLREAGFKLPQNPRRPTWNPLEEVQGERVPEAWHSFLAAR